jgi:hypothetical protein
MERLTIISIIGYRVIKFDTCASPIRGLAISGSLNTQRCPNSLKNRLPKISRSKQAVEPKGPAFRMSLSGFVSYDTALVRAQIGDPSPYLSSDAFVAMMQSADFSDLNDPAGL